MSKPFLHLAYELEVTANNQKSEAYYARSKTERRERLIRAEVYDSIAEGLRLYESNNPGSVVYARDPAVVVELREGKGKP